MLLDDFKCKQVIAVRTDLKMKKGKLAAQVGHAAVSAAEEARKLTPECWRIWLDEGQCKVVIKVRNLAELLELRSKAIQISLPYSLIEDRGLTQLPPNSITCLGIGPAPVRQIDDVTGHLSLL
ncbi:MAG: peptidyl-tRNA hydrolase [Candidatus Bathyarchaeota archaeon]|nr:MAG: peptidyl-tRNA hydrolase [Candidatus Bathyarchaeota archaeon]